jgi:hypothetical protein
MLNHVISKTWNVKARNEDWILQGWEKLKLGKYDKETVN